VDRGRALAVDLPATLLDVRGERNDAVTERADESLLGIKRAHESHVDITAPFEAFGQANVLDAAGGVRLKPGIRINFFAFDCDEAASGVRRNNADRDVATGAVFLAIEFDLEFGIFLQ